MSSRYRIRMAAVGFCSTIAPRTIRPTLIQLLGTHYGS